MKERKHVLEKVHHLIVGFFLTLKGIDKISHHPFIGSLILIFGLVIIAYFFYRIKTNSGGHILHILVHLFEAFAVLFTAYIYFQEGKTYLPYVLLIAAFGFFVSVFVLIRKTRKLKHHG